MHNQFTKPLLSWYYTHGRTDLPWQTPKDAYRIWVSEIMLQQTQVTTVIPYFLRFINQFPDVTNLAYSSLDDVMAHWSGLGYYSRARNIHKSAQIIVQHYNGKFPESTDDLIKLPGIGASTAAAIASLAFNQPTAILDGNVKRVLCRYFMVDGDPAKAQVKNVLWQLAAECMSKTHCADYTQAIMDLGATCCTQNKPTCELCPLHTTCKAYATNSVANYPRKQIKKTKPTKSERFLLLHTSEQMIYLEKRPPAGIWGGLWCMPSLELSQDHLMFVQDALHATVKNETHLLSMKHTFSHFHLHIDAVAIEVSENDQLVVNENTGQWFNEHEISQLGLAKPVKDIIEVFLSTSPHEPSH